GGALRQVRSRGASESGIAAAGGGRGGSHLDGPVARLGARDRDGAALHGDALAQLRGGAVRTAATHELLHQAQLLPFLVALGAVRRVPAHPLDELAGQLAVERLLEAVAQVPAAT